MNFCSKWTFRPKDCNALDYMRRKANEDGRSMNNWLERLLLKMSESEQWATEDSGEAPQDLGIDSRPRNYSKVPLTKKQKNSKGEI